MYSLTDIFFPDGSLNLVDFEKIHSSYDGVQQILEKLETSDKIQIIPHPRENYVYYINAEKKTALFSKCVSMISKKQYIRRKYRKSININDNNGRCTTTDVGKGAVYFFIRDNRYAEYTLAVNCGSLIHEACVFFTNTVEGIDAIFFNPNFSDVTDGVQTLNTANALIKSFGNGIRSIQAYYSTSGNVESNCTSITWEQIYNLIWKGLSPFKRDDIILQDYAHVSTLYAYQKYWIKNSKTLSAQDLKNWEHFDERLSRVTSPLLLLNISNEISQAVKDYMMNDTK